VFPSIRSEEFSRLKGRNFVLGIPVSHASAGKQRALIKWHASCSHKSGLPLRILRERVRKVQRMKREYDLDSAITFLLIGLGIGSVLGIVFNPKQRVPLGVCPSIQP
jgi:hypothetical protein